MWTGAPVVTQLMSQWRAEIAAGVTNMQAAGEISAELGPGRTAAAIAAGIQGGVVMMIPTGDTMPLDAALDLAIGYLQATVRAQPRPRAWGWVHRHQESSCLKGKRRGTFFSGNYMSERKPR